MAVLLADELGRLHAPHRRPDHDPLRRQRPGLPAEARAHPRRHRAHLPRRGGQGQGPGSGPRSSSAAAPPGFGVNLDDRDTVSPGFKYNEWELKGVPVRIEIGPRDVEAGRLRGRAPRAHRATSRGREAPEGELRPRWRARALKALLDDLQKALFRRALKFREDALLPHRRLRRRSRRDIEKGGFFWAHWCGSAACEEKVKDETKATIRCLPFDAEKEPGKCIVCGGSSQQRVVWARAY